MLAFKTILHPTDFSDASTHALEMAIALARDYHATLLVLHAIEPPVYYGEMGATFLPPTEYRETAQERLAAMVGSGAPVTIETVISEGEAPGEILRVARERHCDLIVIGSHGRTGLGRVLMGSVAEEISRKSPCPVLIVRTPHEIHEDPSVATTTGATTS